MCELFRAIAPTARSRGRLAGCEARLAVFMALCASPSGDADLVGVEGKLDPVRTGELDEEVRDVSFDGGFTHEKARRDIGVGSTCGQRCQHLDLAW
jgi:hypothetical protein